MFTTSPEYNNTIMNIGARRFRSKVKVIFQEETETKPLVEREYTDDDIVNISMLEENENLDSLNIGSVIGKSVELRILDLEQEFNPRNPNSEIVKYLSPNRIVLPFLGLEYQKNMVENPKFINGLTNWRGVNGAKVSLISDGARFENINASGNASLQYEGNRDVWYQKKVRFGFKIRKVSGASASYGITLTIQERTIDGNLVYPKALISANAYNNAKVGDILYAESTRTFNSISGFFVETRPETSLIFDVLEVFGVIDDYIEWIPLGNYYTDDFKISEQDITVLITGFSVIPLLDTVNYRFSNRLIDIFNSQNKFTAYDLAEDVITVAGFFNYYLPDYLKDYNFDELMSFEKENISCREVLQYLAELTMSIVQDDREGMIYFDKIKKKVINTTIEAFDNAYNSYPDQLADTRLPEYKYPVLNDGSWTLGDDHKLPNFELSTPSKIGYRGNFFADSSGNLTGEKGRINIHFADSFNVDKIRIFADDKRNEYPVNFTINFYDFFGELSFSDVYTNNDKIEFITPSLAYSNVYTVELVVTKWSKPNTNIKITSFALDEFVYRLDTEYYFRLTNQSTVGTVVTTVEVKDTKDNVYTYRNSVLYSEEGLFLKKIDNNPLILNSILAEQMARDILAYYTANKLIQTVNWVGNPALELTDNLETTDRFNNKSTVNIVSNKIDYNGSLKMETIGMEESYGLGKSKNILVVRG